MLDGSSCAFGVFDGVHTGHRYLLGEAQRTALDSGGASIALTFDIDPDEMFHADRLKKLLGNADRLRMLSESGVDAVCVLPFTREFAAESPAAFLDATFGEHVPAFLHVGRDFRFGSCASGEVRDLERWALRSGTEIYAHHLVSADGKPVTATRIRLLLQKGDVEEAAKLLGYPYTLHETVHPGRGEGREFGFRTANLDVPNMKRVLAEGVYAGYATVDGVRYRAAIAMGKSPVFEARGSADCEVHILDFQDDIYGQDIRVEFHARLRPMIDFASVDELIATVKANIAWVREHMPL
jgi:riboflavin kinase/FMN adenylyltransferase